MATVVTIGRSVDGRPMDLVSWRRFMGETLDAVEAYTGKVYFSGEGHGIYEDEAEASYIVVADGYTVVGEDVPMDEDASSYLRLMRALARLAAKYGQESIALTEGLTQLVQNDPHGELV